MRLLTGMIRGVLPWSSKIAGSVLLVMFCASASLAAMNALSFQSDTIAQTIHPANESPVKTSAGMNRDCFSGYFPNVSSVIIALEGKDMPAGPMAECSDETAAITLHKGDKIVWSLAPSPGMFSLNPIDDIKNLQVLLQFRF